MDLKQLLHHDVCNSFNHACRFLLVNGLHLALIQHLITPHSFHYFQKTSTTETAANTRESLQSVICDFRAQFGKRGIGECLENFHDLCAFNGKQELRLGEDLHQCLEVVAHLQSHLLLLPQRHLHQPKTHPLQPHPTHQKVIGNLAGQGPQSRLSLHQSLQQHLLRPCHSQTLHDEPGKLLVLAGQSTEDAQCELRGALFVLQDSVTESQDEFLIILEGVDGLRGQFEANEEYFQCMFEVERRTASNYSSDAVIVHISRTEPNLSEGVDHPRPILTLPHSPLQHLQDLCTQEPINDQVTHHDECMGQVLIGQFNQSYQHLPRQFLIGSHGDLSQECLIVLPNGPLTGGLHIGLYLFLTDGAADAGESI